MSDPTSPRDDGDREYTKPIGFVAAYELSRLNSGHDAQLKTNKFGASKLDADVPVYLEDAIEAKDRVIAKMTREAFSWNESFTILCAHHHALITKWRHAAEHLGLEGLASLADCADELADVPHSVAALSTHHAAPTPQQEASGVVEVCPDCDIADCRHIRARRAAATAPAGGVTQQSTKEPNDGRFDQLRSSVHVGVPMGARPGGAVSPKQASLLTDKLWNSPEVMSLNAELGLTMDQLVGLVNAVLPLTTAARAAEPAIQLGAEDQKVFVEMLLNPPSPTAAFLKAEKNYNGIVRPTGDQLRAIAKSASMSASDRASEIELVWAGWKAALTTAARAAEPAIGPGIEAARVEARAKALEEAAKECERVRSMSAGFETGNTCAYAIRSLAKEAP